MRSNCLHGSACDAVNIFRENNGEIKYPRASLKVSQISRVGNW